MPVPVLPVGESEYSSRFFPRSYQPDFDGPPTSMLDAAKERLLSIAQDLLDVQQHHLRLLTNSPGYAAFFLTSLDRYERLLNAKPILIQGRHRFLSFSLLGVSCTFIYVPECVADDPWKLLVAVMLLNKTAGRVAVPIFWTLIERWPTPESLAKG